MVCVEVEGETHKRQRFNRPIDTIECVHSTLEDYLGENDLDIPSVIWLDYTDPGEITAQIERFARTIGEVPVGSVLRVTLNANPSSLGRPRSVEVATTVGKYSEGADDLPTLQEWRLERFKSRLGALFPSDLQAEGMTFRTFGKSVLRALSLAVAAQLLNYPDRGIVWALATHYADGQPMVTATLVVCEPDDSPIPSLLQDWEFNSTPDDPHLLDMPALSTIERLAMEQAQDPRQRLGFELPVSDMKEDPFDSFDRFYRLYPHFSRVEL
ncbi:MAG: hypothetical protein RhofKO_17180 [Rhodothermales bacterium]